MQVLKNGPVQDSGLPSSKFWPSMGKSLGSPGLIIQFSSILHIKSSMVNS